MPGTLSPAVRRFRAQLRRPLFAVTRATSLLCAVLGVVSTASAQPITTPAGPTGAQRVAASLGRSVSNDEIARALQGSGLSLDQVRERLRGAGFDPGLADPFFGGTPARDTTTSRQYTSAFRSIGLLPSGTASQGMVIFDTLKASREEQRAMTPVPPPSRVFGKDVFRRASTAFDPVGTGPVDASYRVGANDQLQLVLLGDVELAYQLDVRRDGSVLIPQVGQVVLGGLTLEGARSLLRQRASRSYSGLLAGTTQLDLTVSRVRSNAVFVIGEVEDPGVHQVSALASAFHAIARAGGPTERGSFRAIEVRRGGAVIRRLDLYRYLLSGDANQDLRLEQGDVIFVPLSARKVSVEGAIRRSLEFELLPNETLLDLVSFAGGLTADASTDRLQVDRVLPPAQRRPGFDRVKLDVKTDGDMARLRSFALTEGDRVSVFRVSDVRRNTVRIVGAVHQPGEFAFRPGLTLDSIVTEAQGFQPYARRDRLVVRRLVRATGQTTNITVQSEAADRFAGGFALEEYDEVNVLDARIDFPSQEVTVSGAINRPGALPFLEGETLRDLIERAGGFQEGAAYLEVARRRRGERYTDSTSVLYTFSRSEWQAGTEATSFRIEPRDAVDVRFSPGYRAQRFVQIQGAFINPGRYVIAENIDRISSMIQRAGGLQPHAYGASLQLLRSGLPVAVEYEGVKGRDPRHDLLVRDGDVLQVSVDTRTVRVEGGVLRPSLIRFDPSYSVEDYVERAGGATDRARVSSAVVTSANGLSRRSKRLLWFIRRHPEVSSGATIFVPEKAPSTGSSNDLVTKLFQVTSTIASLVIAYAAASR
jgi:polysaccharide export outer membrane protein